MNRICKVKGVVARFRYWSRKAYAVFASLGKCVTIGCLRKNVVEQSVAKQLPQGVSPAQETRTADEEQGEDTIPWLLIVENLRVQLLSAQVELACAAPAFYEFTIPIYNRGNVPCRGVASFFCIYL